MADTYTYTDIPGENNDSYTYNGNIINVDPHAGNQDPQPHEGGDNIQVLTPAQEANKLNEKIVQIIIQYAWYNPHNGYVYWYHRGRRWRKYIGFDVVSWEVRDYHSAVHIIVYGEDAYENHIWHYPAE